MAAYRGCVLLWSSLHSAETASSSVRVPLSFCFSPFFHPRDPASSTERRLAPSYRVTTPRETVIVIPHIEISGNKMDAFHPVNEYCEFSMRSRYSCGYILPRVSCLVRTRNVTTLTKLRAFCLSVSSGFIARQLGGGNP